MQWFFAIDGRQSGPVEFAEILRLHEAGTLTGDSLVWREGAPSWVKLSTVIDNPAAQMPVPLPQTGESTHTNILAILSLIFGIISVLCCGWSVIFPAAAIVCGHIGLIQIRDDSRQTGRAIARAGFILGYIGLAWGIAQLIAIYGFHYRLPYHLH